MAHVPLSGVSGTDADCSEGRSLATSLKYSSWRIAFILKARSSVATQIEMLQREKDEFHYLMHQTVFPLSLLTLFAHTHKPEPKCVCVCVRRRRGNAAFSDFHHFNKSTLLAPSVTSGFYLKLQTWTISVKSPQSQPQPEATHTTTTPRPTIPLPPGLISAVLNQPPSCTCVRRSSATRGIPAP